MHGTELGTIETWLKKTEWDDQRRFNMIQTMLPNKRLLDFGCGSGGFLRTVQTLAADVTGIEPESRVREYWADQLDIVPSVGIATVGKRYDLITAFHVVERLEDPCTMLASLAELLQIKGRLIVEVPSAQNALLTLYDCKAFQCFTYWSQHLFLFSASTLEKLATQAGLKVVTIQHYQRYPLSNHLYWLSQGKPGGHQCWSFLDTPDIANAYAQTLASLGKTDSFLNCLS